MHLNLSIRAKLIIAFSVIIFLTLIGYFLIIDPFKKTLEQNIGKSSAVLAEITLDKIDQNIYSLAEDIKKDFDDPELKEAAMISNQEFSALTDMQKYINEKDKEWIDAPNDQLSDFMQALLNNPLSKKLQAKQQMNERLHGYQVFSEIFVTNKYGANIASTGRTTDYFQADEEWYQQGLDSDSFWVSDVKYDESAGIYAIDIVIKLLDQKGDFVGMLKVVLNTQEIIRVVKQIDKGENLDHILYDLHTGHESMNIFLLNSQGKVIYSSENHPLFADLSQASFFRAKELTQDDKHPHYLVDKSDSINGSPKLYSYASSQGYKDFGGLNWVLIVSHDTKEVFSPIKKTEKVIMLIIAAIIILNFIIAISLSKYISNLIGKVDRFARLTTKNLSLIVPVLQKVSQGDLSKTLKIKNKLNEFTPLLQAINLMIKDLRKAKQKNKQLSLALEKKVKIKSKELQVSQLKAETILASIGEGVYATDNKGKIILLNKAAENILGWKFKDIEGKKCSEVFMATDKDGKNNFCKIPYILKKALRLNKVVLSNNKNCYYTSKQGKKIPIASCAAPIKDENEKTMGGIVVFRDITKEKAIEKMKSEFLSLASHQLRTPLTGAKWLSELLSKEKIAGKLNKEQKDILAKIHKSNEIMIQLVNDILDVTRIESGRKFGLKLKSINITPIIKNVISEQANLALKNNLNFKIKLPIKLICLVDEEKISQVIQNLVNNAIKYSNHNNLIEVGGKELEDKNIFYVKDNGIGIPRNEQKNIFHKFSRANNAIISGKGGTGLGLYIAKAIIEAHKGRIWFKSKKNQGATFYFSLPSGKNKKN